jgi:hypothetical protein
MVEKTIDPSELPLFFFFFLKTYPDSSPFKGDPPLEKDNLLLLLVKRPTSVVICVQMTKPIAG